MKPTGPQLPSVLKTISPLELCVRDRPYLTIEVSNVGVTDLIVTSVQRLMGLYRLHRAPEPRDVSLPARISSSRSPTTPTGWRLRPPRSGLSRTTRPLPSWTCLRRVSWERVRSPTAIANCGSFGTVCLGSFADELLTINNSGTCPLRILNITGSPDFLAPSVLSYPLLVDPGDSIDVVIRFQPSAPYGLKAGAITILSNDPAGPHVVSVSDPCGAQSELDHRQCWKLRLRVRRLVRRRTADHNQQREVRPFHYRNFFQLWRFPRT